MKKAIAIILILAVLLVSCKETKPEQKPEAATPAAQVTPDTPLTEDVESGIEGIDTINADLDSSDLENLDKELDDINW